MALVLTGASSGDSAVAAPTVGAYAFVLVSGKMGSATVEVLAKEGLGAYGPAHVFCSPGIKRIDVGTGIDLNVTIRGGDGGEDIDVSVT